MENIKYPSLKMKFAGKEPVSSIKEPAGIRRFAWSSDGSMLVVSTSGPNLTHYTFDRDSQKLTNEMGSIGTTGKHESIDDVAWSDPLDSSSQDPGIIATVGSGRVSSGWFETGQLVTLENPRGDVYTIEYSRRTKRFYTTDENFVRSWPVESNRRLEEASREADRGAFGTPLLTRFDPSGRYLAIAGNTIQVFDCSTHEFSLPLQGAGSHSSAMSWTRDGKHLLAATKYGHLQAWHRSENTYSGLIPLVDGLRGARSIALSPDEQILAIKDNDGVFLMRTDDWTFLEGIEEQGGRVGMEMIAFHPELNILATMSSDPRELRLWEVDPLRLAGESTRWQLTIPAPTSREELIVADDLSANTLAEGVSPTVESGETVQEPVEGVSAVQAESDAEAKATAREQILSLFVPNIVKKGGKRSWAKPSTSGLGGRLSEDDHLGFGVTVKAVASFLSAKETATPFVLSVEGAWGAGKSSFMTQLFAELRSSHGWAQGEERVLKFNAWRHADAQGLWSSFAAALIDRLRALAGRSVCRLDLRMRWCRTRTFWERVRMVLAIVGFCATFVFGGLLVVAIWTGGKDWSAAILPNLFSGGLWSLVDILAKSASSVAGIALAILALQWLWQQFAAPLTKELREVGVGPDYVKDIPFIEHFHADLQQVLRNYLGDDRFFIFIDDLDRCAVPRAAELMEALNMMFVEKLNLVFVVGMDRGVVSAGISAKYASLEPHLKGCFAPQGLGHAFLEKFIHLAVRVPQASPRELRSMLEKKLGVPSASATSPPSDGQGRQAASKGAQDAAETEAAAEGALPTPQTAEDGTPRSAEVSDTAVPTGSEVEGLGDLPRVAQAAASASSSALQTGVGPEPAPGPLKVDPHRLLRLAEGMAQWLDHNPRKVEVFMNALHLQCLIAQARGLLPGEASVAHGFALWEEHLARVIVLEMMWPEAFRRLKDRPQDLLLMEAIARGPGGDEDAFGISIADAEEHGDIVLTKVLEDAVYEDGRLRSFLRDAPGLFIDPLTSTRESREEAEIAVRAALHLTQSIRLSSPEEEPN